MTDAPTATARPVPSEAHLSHRTGWLRAAVLGANDGIVSTASLVLGVAAAGAGRGAVVTAGIAGLTAGALSMAAGEYVSVSSQRDTQDADIERERHELETDPAGELRELAEIYEARGLSPALARQVAEELSRRDRLSAHVRDELGLADEGMARPLQAAWSSAASFASGAALPVLAVGLAPVARIAVTVAVTVVALIVLGAGGARLGGASQRRGATRVTLWGVVAMAVTMAIGALVGAAV